MPTTKAQLEESLRSSQETVELLKGIIIDLRADRKPLIEQVERLQDALIAVSSPEAYRDQRMDKLGDPDEISPEQKTKAAMRKQVEMEWLQGMEKNMFQSADDIFDLLGGVIMEDATKSESIHRNTES